MLLETCIYGVTTSDTKEQILMPLPLPPDDFPPLLPILCDEVPLPSRWRS